MIKIDKIKETMFKPIKKLNIKSESLEKYLGATILATGETALVLNPKKL